MPTRPQIHLQPQRTRRREDRRGTAHQRGYTARWSKYSKWRLLYHPACVRCGQPATVTDHKRPHWGDETLFWDENNHQSLCKPCHDTKTATEDGGFGR